MRLYLALTACLMFFVVGCTNNQNVEDKTYADGYESVRKIAWEFIEEQGWNSTAKEDWKSAEVKKIAAQNSYELFNETYVGKEVLAIIFEDKENVVVSTPVILVSEETDEVIGYIAGE
ncbi:hypothetical protein [Sporosarcina koreensis]|uniref:DUF3887 domain-containing protein n=1 Tax=Sporosarcina koreensis TaxID=334735 RepID=A0ABW0TV98_9BACL